MAALRCSQIAQRRCWAAIRWSGLFAVFCSRPFGAQELGTYQVFEPVTPILRLLEMHIHSPGRFLSPKLPTMETHNRVTFHATELVVKSPKVLARNAEP